MAITNTKEPIVLGIGDLFVMFVSLVLTLGVRYLELPEKDIVYSHIVPFTIVFILSLLSFTVAGLYGKRLTLVREKIFSLIVKAQVANFLLALSLFYLFPIFIVAPKTNLLIYIIISTLAVSLWRVLSFKIFSKVKKEKAIILVTSSDIAEIVNELNTNTRSLVYAHKIINENEINQESIKSALEESVSFLIADLSHKNVQAILPVFYHTAFPRVLVVDARDFYMELFDRVPLGALGYDWILGKVNAGSTFVYDFGKRVMDLVLSLPIGLLTLFLYPFVSFLIKIDSKGESLIKQKRIGQGGKVFTIYKFRTMTVSDGGVWLKDGDDRVTKIGRFLRKSRIDELPQVLSVIKGDLSFIGPRPDIQDLGEMLQKDISYYTLRTLIKPGLSGWAQVNQEKPPQSVEETKVRLSYDIYYVIHRSLALDLRIALRTIKTLLSRVGM